MSLTGYSKSTTLRAGRSSRRDAAVAVATLQGGLRFRRTLGGDGRDREFADSPLEQAGFEPLVPLPSRTLRRTVWPALTLRKNGETSDVGQLRGSLLTRRWREPDSNLYGAFPVK